MSDIILTGSSMGTLQTCAENYRLRYVQRLEAVAQPNYLTIGSAFHDAVEVFRNGGTLSDMLTLDDMRNDDDCVVLTAMIEAYHRKYRNEMGMEWKAVELEFILPLSDGVQLSGKVDAMLVAPPRGHHIYETKTVGRIDGAYIDRLWSARQTLIYNWAMNKLHYDVQGVVYDLVGKPTIKRLKATPVEKRKYVVDKGTGESRLSAKQRDRDETDAAFLTRLRAWYEQHPEALHRELIIYTPAQLDSIEQDMRNEVKRLQWHMHTGIWPRSLGSCHRYNRPCEFSPLCSSGGNPVVLETHYRRRDKTHSELSDQGETSDN